MQPVAMAVKFINKVFSMLLDTAIAAIFTAALAVLLFQKGALFIQGIAAVRMNSSWLFMFRAIEKIRDVLSTSEKKRSKYTHTQRYIIGWI